jgi:hypothetical protein
LFRRRLQIAGAFSSCAQHLDRTGYVFGLRRKRCAQCLGPVEMVGEHLYDIWKSRERLHRRIPRSRVDLREISFLHSFLIVGDPSIRLDDL